MPYSRRRKFLVQFDSPFSDHSDGEISENFNSRTTASWKVRSPITNAPLVVYNESNTLYDRDIPTASHSQSHKSSRPSPKPRSDKPESDKNRYNSYMRAHRAKVRSPNDRILAMINTVASSTSDLIPTDDKYTGGTPEAHDTDDDAIMCRICHGGAFSSCELGALVACCLCRGTVGRVHKRCLERWLTESGKTRCEICGTMYATKRVHKYGVLRALAMWLMSHNAKQLVVDSLGIMLMSPLAILAAWLSGRTLAGLMMQEPYRIAPWPLASTFVLACMTLVCYYCWVVSAATRHALAWWVWYRSHYEVHLQLNSDQ